MKLQISNERLRMKSQYAFLFRLPLLKDWAFAVYLVLTFLSIFGGSSFITAVISMYLLSLLWLVPRRIFTKGKSPSNVKTETTPTVSASFVMDKKSNVAPVPTVSTTALTIENGIQLRSGGYQDVVGESNYRKSFEYLAGKNSTGESQTQVALEREPNNKFDKNAVRVHVNGMTLGYLPREDALEWKLLLTNVESMGKTALANARVWWDLTTNSEYEPFGSVQLDLAEPKFSIHVNQRPRESSIDISGSNSYQLTGEQDHLEAIDKLLSSAIYEKGAVAWVELRNSALIEGKKGLVDVFFNNEKIGNLSSVTSAKFAPIISRIQPSGKVLYAECEVFGNSIAAEARLLVTLPEGFSKETVSEIKSLNLSTNESSISEESNETI